MGLLQINKRTKTWRTMGPKERYDYQVQENLNLFYKGEGNYRDPDNYSERIDEAGVRIKTDGLIGHSKIEKIVGDKLKQAEIYKLLREGTYELFAWPVHKGSINQLRGLILDDRVDLTLIDIAKFYEIIDRSETYKYNAQRVKKECKLGTAFANEITYNWLIKYRDFSDFVEKRGLQFLVKEIEESKYIPEEWTNQVPEKENVYKIQDIYLSNLVCRLIKAKGQNSF